jgi:hypothetical protein
MLKRERNILFKMLTLKGLKRKREERYASEKPAISPVHGRNLT